MKTENKILIYLAMLALFDTVIPIPITAIILFYVVTEKPAWFSRLYQQIFKKEG